MGRGWLLCSYYQECVRGLINDPADSTRSRGLEGEQSELSSNLHCLLPAMNMLRSYPWVGLTLRGGTGVEEGISRETDRGKGNLRDTCSNQQLHWREGV